MKDSTVPLAWAITILSAIVIVMNTGTSCVVANGPLTSIQQLSSILHMFGRFPVLIIIAVGNAALAKREQWAWWMLVFIWPFFGLSALLSWIFPLAVVMFIVLLKDKPSGWKYPLPETEYPSK